MDEDEVPRRYPVARRARPVEPPKSEPQVVTPPAVPLAAGWSSLGPAGVQILIVGVDHGEAADSPG